LNDLAGKRPDPELKYYQTCLENRIVAQPVFVKVENKVFSLVDFYISKEISLALKEWLEQTTEKVNEVYIERNGLKDCGLANILTGLQNR
jgi:hypothetical protein